MNRSSALTYLRWTIAGSLCLAVTLPSSKLFLEYSNSQHRGHLASVLVSQQLAVLAGPRVQHATVDNQQLQKRAISELLSGADPSAVLSSLASPPLPPSTMTRWQSALMEWAKTPSARLSNDELLREGRHHYYEATGYERSHLTDDAKILFAWSAVSLVEFIRRAPAHKDLPEALFLLGTDIFRIRSALPEDFRADRIIYLCVELFPESVWADKAHELWMNEVGDHA